MTTHEMLLEAQGAKAALAQAGEEKKTRALLAMGLWRT